MMSKTMAENNSIIEPNKEEDLFIQILKNHFGNNFTLNPDRDKDFQPIIIVDQRERKSGIIDQLNDLGAQVIEETLDAGDYLLSSVVGCERKRGDDFYHSLFAGSNQTNIFEELMRLAESVEEPILFLEDFNLMFKRGEEMKASLYGALVSIGTRLRIPIIPTRNTADTALAIYRIAKQQQCETKTHGISRRAPKSLSLKERQSYFLEGFFNVGPTKADQLIDEFRTPLNFINALMGTEITYTKTGNPKGITGKLENVKGFGWKFVKANKKLLSQEEDEDMDKEA